MNKKRKGQESDESDEDFSVESAKPRIGIKSVKNTKVPSPKAKKPLITTKPQIESNRTEKQSTSKSEKSPNKRLIVEEENTKPAKKRSTVTPPKKGAQSAKTKQSAKDNEQDENISGSEDAPTLAAVQKPAVKSSKAATNKIFTHDDYVKLDARFKQLVALREADEEHIRELRENSETRDQQKDKLIDDLKKKIKQLETKLKTQAAKPTVENSKKEEDNSDLLGTIAKLEEKQKSMAKMIAFHQQLASINLTPVGTDKYECECFHATNPNKSLHFELTITEDEIDYIPLDRAKLSASTPEFLRIPIAFKEDQLTKFLIKTLQFVYKPEDN